MHRRPRRGRQKSKGPRRGPGDRGRYDPNLEPESLLDPSGLLVDTEQRGMADADGAVPAATDPAGESKNVRGG